MTAEERLERYAALVVEIGVNLQPGQRLAINCLLEHAPLARAVAERAYSVGAPFVDVLYSDPWVRRAHIEHCDADALGWSPPWLVARLDQLAADGGALVSVSGNPAPELFADLDGARVADARMRELAQASLRLTDGRCNWCVVGCPNAGWAQTVFGEPDLERLWDAVLHCVRLDEPDPVAAWRTHIAELDARAARLNGCRFDALRYRGPGTDLTVGLLPEALWHAALDESSGIKHVANMPTEEVFTTPDARRVAGTVSATYPLQLQGTLVRGLRVRFEQGRAVEVSADEGEAMIRAHVASDDGSARLGEIALVDRNSRVGQTGLVFYDTLFDENAASHIALGMAVLSAVPGAEELSAEERHSRGINSSSLHTDFMIGSGELDIDGLTSSGGEVPILRGGAFVLP